MMFSNNSSSSLGINRLIICALFASLMAICSWISIPLFFTPVPVNMALAGAYITGLLLGFKYGFIAEVLYILLGAFGLPVFAGFTGGIGAIAGPTGGFIIGYAVCAFICGLPARKKGIMMRIFLMLCGMSSCYGCGLVWFMHLTSSTLWAGLVSCVIPFLAGDAVKIMLVSLLYRYLEKPAASLLG